MYKLEVKESLDRDLKKLKKKRENIGTGELFNYSLGLRFAQMNADWVYRLGKSVYKKKKPGDKILTFWRPFRNSIT